MALIGATIAVSMPATALAATPSSKKNKIKSYTRRLKALADGNTPYIRIRQLVSALSKLNPGKASNYYSIGLRKLTFINADNNAKTLRIALAHIVNHSDLSGKLAKLLIKRINRSERRYMPGPTPPPVSPSAMLRKMDTSPCLPSHRQRMILLSAGCFTGRQSFA